MFIYSNYNMIFKEIPIYRGFFVLRFGKQKRKKKKKRYFCIGKKDTQSFIFYMQMNEEEMADSECCSHTGTVTPSRNHLARGKVSKASVSCLPFTITMIRVFFLDNLS